MASLVAAACVAAGSDAAAHADTRGRRVPSYGGRNWSRKYSPPDRIDAANFSDSRAWQPLVGTLRCTESPARMQRGPSYGYSSVPGAVPAMNAS